MPESSKETESTSRCNVASGTSSTILRVVGFTYFILMTVLSSACAAMHTSPRMIDSAILMNWLCLMVSKC